MDKPIKKAKVAYDYHECSVYLQDKYGYNERDYAGHFGKPAKNSTAVAALDPNDEVPYWDFWHFVCDKGNPVRGGYFVMHEEWTDGGVEPWQEEILRLYLDEFGENGGVEFYADW